MVLAGLEATQGLLCLAGFATSLLERVAQRAGIIDCRSNFVETCGRTLFDRFTNHFPLCGITVFQRVNQRQGWLALGEVVTDVLAEFVAFGGVIQRIVDQLKRGPQVPAVGL